MVSQIRLVSYQLHDAKPECRDFVATYWPNPGTPGSQVKSMYERLAAADDVLLGKDGPPKEGEAMANGQESAAKTEGS